MAGAAIAPTNTTAIAKPITRFIIAFSCRGYFTRGAGARRGRRSAPRRLRGRLRQFLLGCRRSCNVLVSAHLKLPELSVPRDALDALEPRGVTLPHLDRHAKSEQRLGFIADVDHRANLRAVHDQLGHQHCPCRRVDPEPAGGSKVAAFIRADDRVLLNLLELDGPRLGGDAEVCLAAVRSAKAGQIGGAPTHSLEFET